MARICVSGNLQFNDRLHSAVGTLPAKFNSTEANVTHVKQYVVLNVARMYINDLQRERRVDITDGREGDLTDDGKCA